MRTPSRHPANEVVLEETRMFLMRDRQTIVHARSLLDAAEQALGRLAVRAAKESDDVGNLFPGELFARRREVGDAFRKFREAIDHVLEGVDGVMRKVDLEIGNAALDP